MAIIISQKGAPSASVVEKSNFEKEHNLQEYIHEHPEAIPVYDINHDKRLLVVAREFATQSGPIDALATDKDGDIYLVETKLYTNPDKRRVVAQVLDYGASLWKHLTDFETFLSMLDQHVRRKWGIDFRSKAREFFHLDDECADSMLSAMRQNLKSGNLKFVVLMDSMDDGLKDLITYVNQKSQFDIYGVELEFYKHVDYEILIPKIFGVEVRKDNPSPPIVMTKEHLLESIRSKNASEIVKLAEEIMGKLDSLGLTTRGFPSCINYGVEANGDFLSILSLTPTNIWFCLPKRAVDSLGPDRFGACKQKINIVGKFYKPEELDDPTKSGALGPRYKILDGKIESFVEAVRFMADDVRRAVDVAPSQGI